MTELFVMIAERFARERGTPLPSELLRIGDRDEGWCVVLNATDEPIDEVDPFSARVWWNGWLAGLVYARGGMIAAGDAANELTLREWLRGDLP